MGSTESQDEGNEDGVGASLKFLQSLNKSGRCTR